RFLTDDSSELDRLYRDMLVDVTYFFRDPEAFQYLEETVIPELVSAKTHGESLRVWTAGCATGEETYSLAMLFDREIERQNKHIALKVFATDLHQDSIRQAASGIYSDEEISSIPEDLQERYLYVENGKIHVERELRRKVIFAQHDLIKDSTFTNLDFISCRNVLIYFLPEAQQRVLSQFQFGLEKTGVLFLGPSEHLGVLSEDFVALNRTWRIFSKVTNRRYVDSSVLNLPRIPSARLKPAIAKTQSIIKGSIEEDLLNHYMPDSILVDHQWYLVRTFGKGSSFLRIPTGRFDLLVTRMIKDELVTPLRGALSRVSQENTAVRLSRLEYVSVAGRRLVDLHVEPIYPKRADKEPPGPVDIFYLIIIQNSDVDKLPVVEAPSGDDMIIDAGELEYVEELERELTFTRENLQATIEELETTNEELQSANEELLAANEELQSTNEELHSVNEELYTVNSEYISRNEELTSLHDEMRELQKATGTLLIVVGLDMRIRSFSPAAGETFGLLPHDVNRTVTDLNLFDNMAAVALKRQLVSVIDNEIRERYVRVNRASGSYLMHVIPHAANLDSQPDSIVLSFLNISSLENSLNLSEAFNLAIQAPVMIFIYDVVERANIFCSEGSIDVLGYTPEEIRAYGRSFMQELVYSEDQSRIRGEVDQLDNEADGTVLDKRFRMRHKDGHWIWVLSREMVYKRDEEGNLVQFVGAAIDITEEMTAQIRVHELESELDELRKQLQNG
ncbi:MAG: CheR family methyltransferase, partial [Chloroflexota bacterium]